MWKRKIRDLLDYQEQALDGKLKKPDPFAENTDEDAVTKKHKTASASYRKSNSYAKQ